MSRVYTRRYFRMFPFAFDNFIMSYNPQLFVQLRDRLTIQDHSLGKPLDGSWF